MRSFENRRVLVTGSGRGIGKAIARRFAHGGGLSTDEYIRHTVRQLRVTRLGDPSDVAEVVAFLSSENSRWMQGAIVDVDGGQNKGI